mgnify:FL=1
MIKEFAELLFPKASRVNKRQLISIEVQTITKPIYSINKDVQSLQGSALKMVCLILSKLWLNRLSIVVPKGKLDE